MERQLDDNFIRKMTQCSLHAELMKIEENYMKIYDEYYNTCSRDSAFLKDLVDALIGISAVLDVYVEHKEIYPDYAIEKLTHSLSYIKTTINYFENKKKIEGDK